MKFLSLFSGIEAASVAWLPLGWECAAVAEIDPFPCRVLAHHYPDVPNLGDITKITQEQIKSLGHIDLVVGGFPCQDLSVAGLRKGLKNADGSATRSGLFYTALQIARWTNARWLLLENVPGIYSSNNGRDFASMVGEILDTEFAVPKNGWQNSGVAASETGVLEWRTLDAQYFGVPQRRRRMFALADFGNWIDRLPVLFERHSLQGHPAPSREKGQEVAPTIRAGAANGGKGHGARSGDSKDELIVPVPVVAGTLAANGGGTTRPAGNANELDFCITTNRMVAFGEYVDDDLAGSLKQRDYKDATDLISYGIPGNWIGRSPENGGNAVEPMHDVSHCLTKTDQHAVAFHHQASTTQSMNPDTVCPTLDKSKSPAVAFAQNQRDEVRTMDVVGALAAEPGMKQQTYLMQSMQVRRLTPTECARLQGFPDDYLSKVPGASDSAMYKALGNSMAVPVMRWIGQRIQMVREVQSERIAA